MSALSPLHAFASDLLRLYAAPGVVWYHVPEGGSRSARTSARRKRMGILPGVAQICLVLPVGRAAFLEIEGRSGSGVADRLAFRAAVERAGALYATAHSTDDVLRILRAWGAVQGLPSGERWLKAPLAAGAA